MFNQASFVVVWYLFGLIDHNFDLYGQGSLRLV
jgi:hypothetical protein